MAVLSKKDSLVTAHKFLFGNSAETDITSSPTLTTLTEDLDSILLHSEARLRTLIPAILRTIEGALNIEKCAVFMFSDGKKLCDLYQDSACVIDYCSTTEVDEHIFAHQYYMHL